MRIERTIVSADDGLKAAGIEIGPRGAAKSTIKHAVGYGSDADATRPANYLKIYRKADGRVRCRYGCIAAARISDYGTCKLVRFILAHGFDQSRIGHRDVLIVEDDE